MSRFLPNAKRSLDSLLNLITDLAGDVLLFFRLLFRSRTALTVEVLFLRKQLAFYVSVCCGSPGRMFVKSSAAGGTNADLNSSPRPI